MSTESTTKYNLPVEKLMNKTRAHLLRISRSKSGRVVRTIKRGDLTLGASLTPNGSLTIAIGFKDVKLYAFHALNGQLVFNASCGEAGKKYHRFTDRDTHYMLRKSLKDAFGAEWSALRLRYVLPEHRFRMTYGAVVHY